MHLNPIPVKKGARMEPFADNFVPVIESDVLHSPQQPFCSDKTCGCHEDETLIAEVAIFVQDGLLTPAEATEFVKGKGR